MGNNTQRGGMTAVTPSPERLGSVIFTVCTWCDGEGKYKGVKKCGRCEGRGVLESPFFAPMCRLDRHMACPNMHWDGRRCKSKYDCEHKSDSLPNTEGQPRRDAPKENS